jgi:hypothetical protein
VPLIILIAGTRCVGKSWLATQLAERLNLSTVLQTNLVYDLMYTIMKDLSPSVSSPYPPASDIPLLYRNLDENTMMQHYKKDCMMIRDGIDTDIEKCFEEGKTIIIEGYNLDPALFIDLIKTRNIASVEESNNNINLNNSKGIEKDTPEKEGKEREKKKGKGIIIPFILGMNQRDHKLLIENWLSCSARDRNYVKNIGQDADTQANNLVARLQCIQSYLFSSVPPFVRVDVNANAFISTLDVLHSTVLERIREVYSGERFSLE